MEGRLHKSMVNAEVNLLFYFLSLFLTFFSRKIFLDNLGDELVGTMGQLVKKQMTERTDSATGDALERIIDGVTDIIKNGIREE